MHVDDLLGGGDETWRRAMDWIKKELEFGAWETRKFLFRGRQLEQCMDSRVITITMSHYVSNIKSVSVPKDIRSTPDKLSNAEMHSQHRGFDGYKQKAVLDSPTAWACCIRSRLLRPSTTS